MNKKSFHNSNTEGELTLSQGKYPRNDQYSRRYKKNWIILEEHNKREPAHKLKHLETISQTKNRDNAPDFLILMYGLRTSCIVHSYFPEGSKYHSQFKDLNDHPGWSDLMSIRERRIVDLYAKALEKIKINPDDCEIFNEADKLFGRYRHDRWLRSLS